MVTLLRWCISNILHIILFGVLTLNVTCVTLELTLCKLGQLK